ncbi:hypothetical protein [Nautilia sp.]
MKVILYTKEFNQHIKEPVDIILSPQYYWIKKIEIPVKSLKDAKKIAKSLFQLNDGYIYDAMKIEGKYFAYAINKKLKLNIEKKYINSIRLAQSELYKYDVINVSENHSIQKIDDLLFCFPNVKNAPFIDEILPDLKLTNNKVTLYDRINIDKGLIAAAVTIFLLLNGGFIIKTIKNRISYGTLENEKTKLIKRYNLPPTTFQLNSILSSLKKTDKTQTLIRKDLEYITKTPLKKGEKFLNLSFSNKTFTVSVKTDRNLDFYFKKRFKVKSEFKNSLYKAELYE